MPRATRRESRSEVGLRRARLVALFIAAKTKRQVIMVTHNANLVINTDADQIVVAEAGPHPSGGLPPISSVAGGIEARRSARLSATSLRAAKPPFASARDAFVFGSTDRTPTW